MLRIRQVRMLLNGRYPDGSKATFGSDFKFTRYAIVLLAALSLSNFEYHTKKIQSTIFISYYNLYKVAKFLGLEFERTKSAPYIYKELIDRGQVRLTVENNRTFITFTGRGRKSCEEKLAELQLLNEHFNLNPSDRIKYKEKEDWTGIPVKGTTTGSRQQLQIETEIGKLIRKISQW